MLPFQIDDSRIGRRSRDQTMQNKTIAVPHTSCVLFDVLQYTTFRVRCHHNCLWSEEMSLLYDRFE